MALDGSSLVVRRMALKSLTDGDLRCWRDLQARSHEPNPFLSPDFVLPLVTNLDVSAPVVLLVVSTGGTDRWLAAGVFEIKALSRWWVLAYARSFSSDYIFLDGILVDRDESAAAISALFHSQLRHRDWHGMHFDAIRRDSPVADLLAASAIEAGVSAYCSLTWVRASYHNLGLATTDDVLARCSKARRKSLRRGRRKLESQGRVEFRLACPDSARAPEVDAFLLLEKMGWKGKAGTAIACHSDHEAFFRQMIEGFARRRAVLFGELLLDGIPIASTCNLRSGALLSAFKIGWNPAYSDAGIGMWSEVELAAAVSHEYPEIARIDSSAKEGSYVESVWPDRTPMVSITYTWSNRGIAVQLARRYLHLLRRYGARTSPVADASLVPAVLSGPVM